MKRKHRKGTNIAKLAGFSLIMTPCSQKTTQASTLEVSHEEMPEQGICQKLTPTFAQGLSDFKRCTQECHVGGVATTTRR